MRLTLTAINNRSAKNLDEGRLSMTFRAALLALCIALSFSSATNSRAEVNEITVAQQYGVSFLPLMVMEKQALVEKHWGKIPRWPSVTWQRVR